MKRFLWVWILIASFAATAEALIIEDFEDGNWSEYTARNWGSTTTGTLKAEVTSAAARHGNYGLELRGTKWIYRNDPQVQVCQGQTIGYWSRTALTGTQDNITLGFGATAASCYGVGIDRPGGRFVLWNNWNYEHLLLAQTPVAWQRGHWYYVEVDWRVGGTMIATCYDGETLEQIAQVQGVHTAITSGGIAFRSPGLVGGTNQEVYIDTVSRETPVPEPSALLLLSSGVLACTLWRAAKRRVR